ncbi:MAG: hypothetical protein WC822_04585 [Candidatus Paceibacterota bacterium]
MENKGEVRGWRERLDKRSSEVVGRGGYYGSGKYIEALLQIVKEMAGILDEYEAEIKASREKLE